MMIWSSFEPKKGFIDSYRELPAYTGEMAFRLHWAGRLGSVFEATLNILFSKMGISLKNIFASFTAGKKIKDDVDWNTGSFDVGFAMANLSICDNASHSFLLKSVKKGLLNKHHLTKLYAKLQVEN